MASPRSLPREAAMATVAALLAGVLGYLGTGLHPVAALTWLAPLPVLLAAPRVRWPLALGAAAAGWVAAQSGLWSYFAGELDMPPAVLVAVLAFYPLLAVASTALFRALLARGRPLAAALAVPAVWVTGEYVLSTAQPHGAWLSLGYTQAAVRPVLQIASATGIWGVTFLLTGVAAAVAAVTGPAGPALAGGSPDGPSVHRAGGPGSVTRAGRIRVAVVSVVLLLVAGGYAADRVLAAPAAGRVRIAVLAGPADGELRPDSAAGRALLAGYTQRIGQLAGRGVRVVVLPEKVFDTDGRSWPLLAGPLGRLAAGHHVDIVVGAVARHGGTATNVAVAFPATGGAPVTYTKQHLIPGLETDELEPGHGPLRRLPDNTRLGLIVCKDLDFPGLVRDNRTAGAAVLLAPAWDMGRDGWLHSRMAVTRGVESGLWVARAGRYGHLTISDPTGRVVAEADATTEPGATIIADVGTGTAPTLYARAGDWFAWLCAVALAALLATTALRRRRPQRPHRSR
jgi:apolipoprotein N-acyltransferase